MGFRKYSEKDLAKIKRRNDLFVIIENIEKHGIEIDMAKYPKSTLPYLRQAVLEHQDLVVIGKPRPESESFVGNFEANIDPVPESIVIESEPSPEPEPEIEEEFEELEEEVEDVEVQLSGRKIERQKRKEERNKRLEEKKARMIDWRVLPEAENKDWITKMYWKHLYRPPDGEGMATYMRHLSLAKSREEIKRARASMEAAISQGSEAKSDRCLKRKRLYEELYVK